MDWHSWHDAYEDPGSSLSQRLTTVQDRIREALDAAPPGPLRAVSLCAGQGRDLIPVLAEHPRGKDVRARLVELDPENAESARERVRALGLDPARVEVVTGDAALTDHYADLTPAHLVVICGLFGNITVEDIRNVIAACRRLTAHGGTVVWTRGRSEPDRYPAVCAWFAEAGFEQVYASSPDVRFGVGAHRFPGEPQPYRAGERLFTFVGYDVLHGWTM
jgi:hypothetical protein